MYYTTERGKFGAGIGRTQIVQYHPAIDMYMENGNTEVNIYAAHDGYVRIYRNAPKYRHFISITKDISDDSGKLLGKVVTIYGHVDLDLDSSQNIIIKNKQVHKGDLISKNLYHDTRGGPHLHFEVRYYRPSDNGDEEFYRFEDVEGKNIFTEPSAGQWEYGFWDPDTGYGYANPDNHFDHSLVGLPAERSWRR